MTEGADKEQRTEQPTSKRISEARGEGSVPVSREMSAFILFIACLIVVWWLGPFLGRDMQIALRVFLERPHEISLEGGGISNALTGVVSATIFPTILILGLLLGTAVWATMVQTDYWYGTGKLKFDLSALLPMNGIKRLFSVNSLAELLKSFLKLVVLGYIAYRVLLPVFDVLPLMAQHSLMSGIGLLHDEAIHLIIVLLFVIGIIATADILWVRYQYFKGLRMTKQEVKDEHKQMEGDPLIKGKIRQMRIEKARRRMMASVPNASVIVTNPTHYAVALQYDGTKMAAPVVTAKGLDRVALRIREIAEENEVPLVSNPPLARALHDTVEIDQPITPEHYRAVAEVISFVYKMKKKK